MHRYCFLGGTLPCYLARQLQIPFHSYCRGESMWFWGCEAERPAKRTDALIPGDAKRTDALIPGMQDFIEGFMQRSCGCRGAHPCRALACVHGRQCLPPCLSRRVLWGAAGRCVGRVPCAAVREVGQSPLGWQKNCWVRVAPGPAQENAPSWLWDAVEDFNECFFPFLSKLLALMESLIQAEAPRAPVEPFCAVLLTPVVKSEPHTPARC